MVLLLLPLLARAEPIVWGNVTNGVQAGLCHVSQRLPGNGMLLVYLRFSTNYAKNLIAAEEDQQISIEIQDKNGTAVATTSAGARLGKPLETKLARHRKISRQLKDVMPEEPTQYTFVDIDKCFIIKETGSYGFTVIIRILVDTGEKLIPFEFEPLSLRIDLTANNARSLGSSPAK